MLRPFAPPLSAIAALCLSLGAACAGAQPARVPANVPEDAPLHLIVPLGPGGSSDTVARALADALRPRIGRAVLVENRPGAGGRIAVDALQRARPDGLTLLMAPLAVPVLLPLITPDAADAVRAMLPVGQLLRFDYALAVAPGPHAASLAGFLAWLHAHPERAQFGTQGTGSVPQLLGTSLAREARLDLAHAPYLASGLLNADVMNGTLAAAINATSDFVPLHQAGRLRILATSGRARSDTLPDVPTFAELGWPALTASGWVGLFATAGTPRPTLEALAAAISAAMRDPAVAARLAPLGLEPATSTPDELAAVIERDRMRWGPLLRQAGVAN